MVKTRRTVLLLLSVIFITCIIFFALIGHVIGAKADCVEESEDFETQFEEDLTVQTGVGLGINVLTAQSLTDFKIGYNILDQDALNSLSMTEININQSSSSHFNTTDVQILISNYSNSLSASVGFEYFLFNLALQLRAGATFSYENYIFKYFDIYYHNIYRTKKYINNYLNRNTYENAYSSSFLSDLQALSNNTLTYETFFNRYGTHLVGSAIFGGKLFASYSLLSNVAVMNESNELYIAAEASVLAGESDSYIKGKVATALNSQTSTNISISNFKSNFSVNSLGGNYYVGANLANFATNSETWATSFTDNDANVIVDYTSDGLVPLWDILPDEYESLSSSMESAYQILSAQAKADFIDEFKVGNYTAFAGGDGSPSNPFLISTESQLGNIESTSMTSCYKLKNSITLSNNTGWNSIGGFYKERAFKGVFDGNYYSIYGLTRTTDISEVNNRIYFGFFGYIGKDSFRTGNVKNLYFRNLNINMTGPAVDNSQTNVFVGVVAGVVDGGVIQDVTISTGNCSYNCCTNGTCFVGGIVGLAKNATIYSCKNRVNITSGRYSGIAGGIVGYSYHSNIYDCKNYGTIQSYCTGWGGTAVSGGIVGAYNPSTENPNHIFNCVNNGTLSANYYSWSIIGCTLQTGDIYGKEWNYTYD